MSPVLLWWNILSEDICDKFEAKSPCALPHWQADCAVSAPARHHRALGTAVLGGTVEPTAREASERSWVAGAKVGDLALATKRQTAWVTVVTQTVCRCLRRGPDTLGDKASQGLG